MSADTSQPRTTRQSVRSVLRVGLAAGMLLMGVGLLLALVAGRHISPVLRPRDVLAAGAAAPRVIAAGILALALTPIAGVLALIIGWIRQADYRFAALGVLVATLLALAALTGGG